MLPNLIRCSLKLTVTILKIFGEILKDTGRLHMYTKINSLNVFKLMKCVNESYFLKIEPSSETAIIISRFPENSKFRRMFCARLGFV